MRNRLFILGAGFSAAASVPLTVSLLQQAMECMANECPGLYSRIDNYASDMIGPGNKTVDYSQLSLSRLCTYLEYIELREFGGGERWSSTGSREKHALNFYLAKTLVKSTPRNHAVPSLYVDFAKQLHKGDIVLSFNWDGLLEVALDFVGKKYSYNFAGDTVWLCKLHGSVNWTVDKPHNFGRPVNRLGWKSLGFSEGTMSSDIYFTPALLDFEQWIPYSPFGEVKPFLVLPGYGKAFDVRSNAVLWYKPEIAFKSTHDVYIIGLGLSPDDFFIKSFFLNNLPYIDSYSGVTGRKVFVINPCSDSCGNIESTLGGTNAELIRENFGSSHVSLMKSRLT